MSLINIEKTITLDVYDHDTTPSVIKTIQLDTGTRTVFAVIQNSRQDYDIGQNATVSLTVLRPDKTKVQITGQPYISHTGTDGTMYGAKADLSDVALAVKGNLKAQFKITSGEQELRTEIFAINNGEALDAGDGDWAGDLDGHNLDEMAEDIEDAKAAVSEMETDVSELKEEFDDLYNTAYVTDSASGSVAHFVDGADNIPMKSVKVNIAPVQSGSGDPSPTNIRPISGWDSVKVIRTGKNLIPYPYRSVDGTYQNVTMVTNSDGSVTFNGIASANSYFNFVTEADEFAFKAGSYILSANTVPDDCLISVNVQVNGVNKYNANLTAGNTSVVFTPQEDGLLRCYVTVKSGATVNDWTVYPMLRLASDTDDTYEPYNGNAYDISLASAGTVYGGMLDAVSGVLTVDKGFVTLDGTQTIANSNWRATSNSVGWLYPYSVTQNVVPNSSMEVPDVISNRVKTASYSAAYNGTENNCVSLVYDTSKVYGLAVRCDNTLLTTDAAINAFLAENPIQVVYSLATPLTYQLSATEIKSLLGINNVWSDAGDVELEYRADTKLYIDKRLGV